MSKEIRVWQIEDDTLTPLENSLQDAGKTEPVDLQNWIRSSPELLGDDIIIIGEQVSTRSGFMDFLGVDDQGNTVVVELKRDMLPRGALAQAIDYASDVASWDLDKLSLECSSFLKGRELAEYLNETREDVNWELVTFNETQRILLVGTGVEESLQRMIEWLSDNYAVSINAVIFRYVRTTRGDELLVRTVIVPDEVERRDGRGGRKFAMSDVPGDYPEDELREHLQRFLAMNNYVSCRLMRTVLLPMCLADGIVSREKLRQELIRTGAAASFAETGTALATIAGQIRAPNRAYLRQVIRYAKNEGGQIEHLRIPDEYKPLVREVLDSLEQDDIARQDADAQGQTPGDGEQST